MPDPTTPTTTRHRIAVDAPITTVYDLLADVRGWPRMFGPTVHVDHLGGSTTQERLRIWATTPHGVRSWTSRRTLDPVHHRIRFVQEQPATPVAAMSGEWCLTATTDQRTDVALSHTFRALGDDPAALAVISEAVERNSDAELGALAGTAASIGRADELSVLVEDTVSIDAPTAAVAGFLWDAESWPVRLQHVAGVRVQQEAPDVQRLAMDTRAADGSTHTTLSVRLRLGPTRIAYKQIARPPFMAAHLGEWTLAPEGGGTRATSRHTVVLDPDGVRAALGEGARLADARVLVARSLSNNSRATLQAAGPAIRAGAGRSDG